jgi:hypothetical protein
MGRMSECIMVSNSKHLLRVPRSYEHYRYADRRGTLTRCPCEVVVRRYQSRPNTNHSTNEFVVEPTNWISFLVRVFVNFLFEGRKS